MIGQLDHLVSQKLKRPTGPPGGGVDKPSPPEAPPPWLTVCGQRLAGVLRSTRLRDWPPPAVAWCDKWSIRYIQGRSDHLVAHTLIRRQQDLRTLEPAGRVMATAQKGVQLLTFKLAEFHTISYIHLILLTRWNTGESQINQTFGIQPSSGAPQFTRLQGQYLAFIDAYTRIFERSPGRSRYASTLPSDSALCAPDGANAEKPVSFNASLEKREAFNCSYNQKRCPQSSDSSTRQNLCGMVLAARGVTVSHNAIWQFMRREGLRFKKNAVRP